MLFRSLDPLLAVAQMILETGNLNSKWSQPPYRNPAGIGIPGGDPPPFKFDSWHVAVRAHLGRRLRYAIGEGEESEAQREMIAEALTWRDLPKEYWGVAPQLRGLTGRWAMDRAYDRKIAKIANSILAFDD